MNIMEMQPTYNNSVFGLENCFDGFDNEFSYLIKGYLPTKALGMVYGQSGAFKSFHVLSWACSIALGQEWNNCKVSQSPVLYIAGEGGLGVPRRIKAWCNRYNSGNPIDNFYRLDHPVFFGEPQQIEQLIRTLKFTQQKTGIGFGLIVIDTLARCFNGDENRSDDMNRFVAACDRIKTETGATVLVVHHSGKDTGKGARGSSVMRAACDFEYSITRANNDNPALILQCSKAKDESEAKTEMFELTERFLFTDADGDEINSLACAIDGQEPPKEEESKEIKLGKNEHQVWQAIRSRMASQETTGYKVIQGDLKAQGFNISNYSKVVSSLIAKGIVKEENKDLFIIDLSE
jgi:hypothetical protein